MERQEALKWETASEKLDRLLWERREKKMQELIDVGTIQLEEEIIH